MSKTPAFWDSSALVLLCTNQRTTPNAQLYYRRFSLVVWWSTVVEVRSAICRLHRNQKLKTQEQLGALSRLRLLANSWREVLPDDQTRDLAAEALDKYPLASADALQLGAALSWCQQRPAKRSFLTADQRLADAARAAGFSVIGFP